jgi:hypothetical protein
MMRRLILFARFLWVLFISRQPFWRNVPSAWRLAGAEARWWKRHLTKKRKRPDD